MLRSGAQKINLAMGLKVSYTSTDMSDSAKSPAKKKAAKKATKSLVIVESPAKASTIRKYLGANFEVKASVGHIRDLPKSKLGIDPENNFALQYVTIKGKANVIKELKSAAKKADVIYLAPDPDREGEAIAQHIYDVVNAPDKIYRVMFNEITKKAVTAAIENPRKINDSLVQAQQARRALDRLVGYKLSPLLWNKVRSGLSAGRVQSVAMRIIVDREKEIEAFIPREYWSIRAILANKKGETFEAKLHQIDGQKFDINNEADALAAVAAIRGEALTIASIELKDRRRNAPAPFITSTLQQAASQRYRFNAGRTMRIAQKLYEGMDVGHGETVGLITYMRTDSTRIADDAIAEVRGYIKEQIGDDYLPEKPNAFASRDSAQEAHEAIRPTSVARTPESLKKLLSAEEYKLYDLIWKRFVASQMTPAVIATLTVDTAAGRHTLRATGSQLKFAGFLKVYKDDEEEKEGEQENKIPQLETGETVALNEITPNQHFTQPPPRYTEASLIKELEEKGIGRPSTYASIMETIRSRDYAMMEDRRLKPTELGRQITDLLMEHFPSIMDLQFTAQMEDGLDKVEEGGKDWVGLLREFYGPFTTALEKADAAIPTRKMEEPTDEVCEKCGAPMVIKHGRFGRFMACSAYPKCRNAKPIKEDGTAAVPEKTGDKCPTCGKDMVLRTGRFGKFIACEDYPTCKTTKPVTLGIKCPECGTGELVERKSKARRFFYGCSRYPDCKYVSWEKPVKEPCPKCNSPFLVFAGKKGGEQMLKCPNKACDFTKPFAAESADTEPVA